MGIVRVSVILRGSSAAHSSERKHLRGRKETESKFIILGMFFHILKQDVHAFFFNSQAGTENTVPLIRGVVPCLCSSHQDPEAGPSPQSHPGEDPDTHAERLSPVETLLEP